MGSNVLGRGPAWNILWMQCGLNDALRLVIVTGDGTGLSQRLLLVE
jgi:hypothetical protein